MTASERSLRRAAIVLAVLLCTPARAAAQVARYCDVDAVLAEDTAALEPALRAQHPRARLARVAPQMAQGRWDVVIAALVPAVSTFSPADSVTTESAERFAANADSTFREFERLYGRADRDAMISNSAGVKAQRFALSRAGAGVYRLFVAQGDPTGVAVDASLPEPARRALCWRAITMHAALDEYRQSGLQKVVAELDRKARLWARYNRNTPTQYPWELGLNGWSGHRRLLEPPTSQWILLHPSATGELAGRRLDSLQFRTVVAMEWLGRVWSLGEQEHSLGASLMSTLATNAPASIGVMLRSGRVLALGGFVRRSAGRTVGGAAMSADLYRLLVGVPDELKQAAAQAAATRDAAIAAGAP